MRRALTGPLSFGLSKAIASPEGVGVVYEAETEALVARFTTPPDPSRKVIINNLIVALKAAGVWSKLDAFYILAAADSQAARRNWVQDAYNISAVNAPTFTVDRGYAGDGSSSYLTTNFNPVTALAPKFTQNDAHASLYDRTSRAANGTIQMGGQVSPAGQMQVDPRFAGDLCFTRVNDSGGGLATPDSAGRVIGSRQASGSRSTYRNGASLGSVAVSSVTPNSGPFFLCGGSSGGAFFNGSTDQLGQASFGSGFSALEAAAFDAAVANYLSAVGA